VDCDLGIGIGIGDDIDTCVDSCPREHPTACGGQAVVHCADQPGEVLGQSAANELTITEPLLDGLGYEDGSGSTDLAHEAGSLAAAHDYRVPHDNMTMVPFRSCIG
jgi:hypothetical protein